MNPPKIVSILRSIAAVGSLLLLGQSAQADIGTVIVDARSSVFSQQSNPRGSWDSSSLPGVTIALSAGTGRVLTLPSVSGLIDPAHTPHGADGGNYSNTGVNINSLGSISGVIDSFDRTMALMGVFLAANPAPAGAAPARLNFTGNHSFASLSPLLNQTFFLGDGLTGTGSGALQTFLVPDAANFIQFGFADACCNPFVGDPGYYGDNHGFLTVQYSVSAQSVSEPGSLALVGLSLLGLGLRRRNGRSA